MERDCIPRSLSDAFYVYGKFVSRHPLPFLVCPIITSLILMAGLARLDVTSELEYLYTPINAPSKQERQFYENTFPSDDENLFSPVRQTNVEGFLQVHMQDPSNTNVLNNDAVDAIFNLDDFILNVEITHDGSKYKYNGLCSSWKGECEYSKFLKIMTNVTDVSCIDITYPLHFLPDEGVINLISDIGGVEVNDRNIIQSARAIQIVYHVRYQDPSNAQRSDIWLNAVRDQLFIYNDHRIEIAFQTSLTLEQEIEASVKEIIPLFSLAFSILMTFSVVSCLMFDWVRSKPWVALGGLVAATLGIGSSLGLMSAVGVKFTSVVGSMPFLIIGIGIDDMFILVSAWRYTSVELSTEERLGTTLQSAAVSITITSITDALAFGIGSLTPFRCVRLFCAYTVTGVCFTYLYMITFTLACMAYSGRREEANRHVLTCFPLSNSATAQQDGKSKAYEFCCTSPSVKDAIEVVRLEKKYGDLDLLPSNGLENKSYDIERKSCDLEKKAHDHELKSCDREMISSEETIDTSLHTLEQSRIYLPFLNEFLGTTFADFILRPASKATVVLVYIGLMSAAIYGITVLDQEMDLVNLTADDSYFSEFYWKFQRDFMSRNGPMVMVAFDESLDYTDHSVRTEIDNLIDDFQQSHHFIDNDLYVISWLHSFEKYLEFTGTDIDNLPLPDFISILHEFLLIESFEYFAVDLVFNANSTEILCSRILLPTESLPDSVAQLNMMRDARRIAENSEYDVIAYSAPFIYYDQYDVILKNTVMTLSIAVVSMMVVSLLLIPSITTVICVTMATISICTCVMGYMSLWDVSLDAISMINLVMCIGFSVDFAAHISYHFVISDLYDPNERAKEALGYLGTPIVQGALSTVMAVLVLAGSNSYIFRTFFKIVFFCNAVRFFPCNVSLTCSSVNA